MLPGRFSKKTYAIPFGRYVSSSEVEPPADEVFVGREGQRAFLIENLISTGRRGAFLVSGRRGTGKSSFVRHCIEEYRAGVFRRFLRGNVGRSFWDRTLILLFGAALLAFALTVSELTYVVLPLSEGGGSHKLLSFLLVPIGITLLYPCVYANLVIETVLRQVKPVFHRKNQLEDKKKAWLQESHFSGVTATTLTVIAAFLCCYFLPFAPPALGVISFAPIVGGIYLAVQAASFKREKTSRHLFLPVAILLIVFFSLTAILAILPPYLLHLSNSEAFRLNSGAGLTLLGVGCLLRNVYQRQLAKKPHVGDAQRQAFIRGGKWYLGIGMSLVFGGAILCCQAARWSSPAAWTLSVLLLSSIGLIFVAFPRRGESCQFLPRPALALNAKALLSIVVSLQLVQPLLERLPLPRLPAWPLRSLASLFQLCHPPLFATRYDEGHWLLAVLALLVVFYFLEYEWIVRPYVRTRAETNLDSSPSSNWDDQEDDQIEPEERRPVYRRLAALTLPWSIYETWLPILPIQVNLGFDRLGHRAVIQAMLVGLRDRYHRFFLAWNSAFANLGRFFGVCALLVLVNLASAAWFALPTGTSDTEACSTGAKTPGVVALLCQGNALWFKITYFDFFPKSLQSINEGEGELPPFWDLVPPSRADMHIRTYHLVLFFLFFILGKSSFRKIPILPYQQNLRRIDDLLNSLSQRTKETASRSFWGPARWVYSFLIEDRVQETERDPVDPRTVELAFLQILEDIQKGGFRMPGAARNHLTMPAPEITFIFDELDKLGTRVDPEGHSHDEQSEERELIHRERQRSINLRALLSDLKNVLASAPARFIFVGGRDLHDEWLADQTSRLPLLTSIFNTEVYLPSLLTDLPSLDRRQPSESGKTPGQHAELPRLHSRIEEYLIFQHRRAQILYFRSLRKRWRPSLALPLEAIAHDRFVPESLEQDRTLDSSEISAIACESGDPLPAEHVQALRQEFILFLTLRSMGNPKKLKELLGSFVRPAGRELKIDALQAAACRHLLRLGDIEIFRIQLVVDIYRHLAFLFEERMVQRDDKFAISIFFLTDFLFKFHRRAFSWSNLERVDDLAHIHRLPDLRDMQEEIVDHFSERFLHRVLNGMYAFRFRSNIAREVEYLSRRSPEEMAAFNFTLDESQSLKADYLSALRGKESKNPDLAAALGELYEFDQDFDRARQQYRVTIDLLDKDLAAKTGTTDIVGKIFLGTVENGKKLRPMMAWALTRLRLMLQVGMTFEYARDLEKAEAEYRSARTLARALMGAYVGSLDWPDSPDNTEEGKQPLRTGRRLHSLKQMHILFQPMFAEAWVAEKFSGTIDTSITLVERQLWEVRRVLPFVREAQEQTFSDQPSDLDKAVLSHANFALTLSQLHNKAGDIFFFKGRQPITPEHIFWAIKNRDNTDRSTDGYLLRAHYHYALGLHDLRHFISHRVARSKHWLSIASPGRRSRTLQADALPDFIFRAAAGSVNDMAEATIARVSLFEILTSSEEESPDWTSLKEKCLKWLGEGDLHTREKPLADWFGSWLGHPYTETLSNLIEFTGPDDARARLRMSLRLCFAGSELFAEGGYPEDAGRELLQACETVTHYVWWGKIVQWLGGLASRGSLPRSVLVEIDGWRKLAGSEPLRCDFSGDFWNYLIGLAIDALQRAADLFYQSRYRSSGRTSTSMIGETVPPEAVTVLCSLALAGFDLLKDQKDKVASLLQMLTGLESVPNSLSPADFTELLKKTIERNRYPMINRLNGMRVLIDNMALSTSHAEDDFEQALTWTEEMLDINTLFDSPYHFTPLHSGVTCVLVWIWGLNGGKKRDSLSRILHAAQRDLQNSEEMYTMRRAYYESINDLYYLYDDFNDRQIHFNHAIQMAGAELVSILKVLVDLGVKDDLILGPAPEASAVSPGPAGPQ